jgi:hypothetical protein
MAYHLLNIETSEYHNCDDREWINAIDTAKENWWEPDGTIFDYFYNAYDECFDTDDIADYFFELISLKNESLYWDGSYILKRNQVVLYEDAIYLAIALKGTDVSTELIEFINKGSFRICSD